MSIELKPCPFCGGEALLSPRGRETIDCGLCRSRFSLTLRAGDGASVVARWNRRAPSPAVRELAEVARLVYENFKWSNQMDWRMERALAAVEREIGGA